MNIFKKKKEVEPAPPAPRLKHFGIKSYLAPTAQILGVDNVSVGDYSTISDDCWLNVNHRDEGAMAIDIGSHCFLGRRNFITSGKSVTIGDYCMTAVDCHFLGADHVISDPMVPYLVSGVTKEGEIRLGVNVWLGTSVTILDGVEIGHGSIIGAGSLVTSSIPPFSVAVGSPARVIKRYSFEKEQWLPESQITEADHAAYPAEQDYLNHLKEKWPTLKGPRVAATAAKGDV